LINVAILGYGNLGKAVEKLVADDQELHLVGIFSRRKLDCDNYFDADTILQFANEIDVVIVCTASVDETEKVVQKLAGKVNTVDTFDNHNRVAKHKQSLDCLAKQGKTTSIVSVGWDPGILSMARAICGVAKGNTQTFWGKGVSQGHSNALKKVAGVVDGVQFTIPNRRCIARARRGVFESNGKDVCKRQCFVVATTKKGLKRRICGVKDYFEGYKTQVFFVGNKTLARLKKQTGHKGRVVFVGKRAKMEFALSTKNNALLTAEIALSYAKIVPTLQKDGYFGAFDCLDIPLKYLCNGGEL
jgi:diaminopimelate dehydrogenase